MTHEIIIRLNPTKHGTEVQIAQRKNEGDEFTTYVSYYKLAKTVTITGGPLKDMRGRKD